jgi:predicted nucleic acid-binding Zn ribbon protein
MAMKPKKMRGGGMVKKMRGGGMVKKMKGGGAVRTSSRKSGGKKSCAVRNA